MSKTTYDYQTGQIKRDFHFVRYGEKCLGSGLPCKAGNGRCRKCKHNGGMVSPILLGFQYWNRFEGTYVKCRHEEAKDSEETDAVRSAYYDYLEEKALCALCY